MTWTAPRTWVAGETVTAAIMNTHVRDNLKAIGDPWTAYTPTLTNITLGNGTLSAAYVLAGSKWMHGRVRFAAGSTTTYAAGNLGFSVPATPLGAGAIADVSGYGQVNNGSGATRRLVLPIAVGAATLNLAYEGATVSNTTPFAFGTASQIGFTFDLETV